MFTFQQNDAEFVSALQLSAGSPATLAIQINATFINGAATAAAGQVEVLRQTLIQSLVGPFRCNGGA